MRKLRQNRKQPEQKADKSTLGLLFVLIIVIFMALTFGEAEGVTHMVEKGNVFLISSL